jgi:hypothetical protein
MLNKNSKASIKATTASGGDTRATCTQSWMRSNKKSFRYKLKKCEPDDRQLEIYLGISKQVNTGGAT